MSHHLSSYREAELLKQDQEALAVLQWQYLFLFFSLQVHYVIYFQTDSSASMLENSSAAGESNRIFISSLGAPLLCQVGSNW